MEINITGRNLGITDRFRDYATEKAERVEHLAESRLEVDLLRATGSATLAQGPGRGPASPLPGNIPKDGTGTFDLADDDEDEPRILRLRAIGPRWAGIDFSGIDRPGEPTE